MTDYKWTTTLLDYQYINDQETVIAILAWVDQFIKVIPFFTIFGYIGDIFIFAYSIVIQYDISHMM